MAVSPQIPTDERQRNPLWAVEPIALKAGHGTPEDIYVYLRRLILSGELTPGAVISQVMLAKALGISRTPLREAMRLLQQEGLVEAEHNRRSRVVPFDPDDLETVYCNRLMLESLGIAVTVPRLSGDDVAVIEGLLVEMTLHRSHGDQETYEKTHRAFHAALVMHADPALRRQISSFAERGNRYRSLYRFNVEGADEFGASEHRLILDACINKDQSAAVTALTKHLSHTALGLHARMAPERDPASLRTALRIVTGQLRSS